MDIKNNTAIFGRRRKTNFGSEPKLCRIAYRSPARIHVTDNLFLSRRNLRLCIQIARKNLFLLGIPSGVRVFNNLDGRSRGGGGEFCLGY